jgi:hypothetical protein
MFNQEIISIIITNATTAGLILFIFGVYKKKVEDVVEDVEAIKNNYLTRFAEIKDLIIDNDKIVMGKLHDLENKLTAVQTTCAFIQKTEMER